MVDAESKIKTLINYGLISEEESQIILALYKKENRTKEDELEIVETVKKNIGLYKEKEEGYKKEIADLAMEEKKVLNEIVDLRLKRARKVAKMKAEILKKEKLDSEKRIEKMGYSYKSLLRKIDEIGKKIREKKEHLELQKIREKLQ